MTTVHIAKALSRDIRTIDKWTGRFMTTGEIVTTKRPGRPRQTSRIEDNFKRKIFISPDLPEV